MSSSNPGPSKLAQTSKSACVASSKREERLPAVMPCRLGLLGQSIHADKAGSALDQQAAAKAQRPPLAHGAHVGLCSPDREIDR